MEFKHIECDCSCQEHGLRFIIDNEDKEFPFLVIGQFMNNYDNIFKRIWTAIKYIFRKSCKYGHFCECLIHKDNVQELIDILEEVKIPPQKGQSLTELVKQCQKKEEE